MISLVLNISINSCVIHMVLNLLLFATELLGSVMKQDGEDLDAVQRGSSQTLKGIRSENQRQLKIQGLRSLLVTLER